MQHFIQCMLHAKFDFKSYYGKSEKLISNILYTLTEWKQDNLRQRNVFQISLSPIKNKDKERNK